MLMVQKMIMILIYSKLTVGGVRQFVSQSVSQSQGVTDELTNLFWGGGGPAMVYGNDWRKQCSAI